MSPWLLLACGAPDPTCREETCAAPEETGTPGAGGNDVDLDRYPPVVIASDPPAGALGVDAGLDTIRVTFSVDMLDGSWSWVQADPHYPPGDGGASYEDERTNVLDGRMLAADTAYHAWINDPSGTYTSFQSAREKPALPWSLAFSTGAEASALAAFPPVVVETEPVAGAEGVDPATDTVRVRFSKALAPDRSSLRPDDEETDPSAGDPTFVSPTEVEIPIALAPGTTYALWINEAGEGFEDTDGLPVVPWLLTFRTSEP